MQLIWDKPVHPYCRTSEDLFSGTKFPFAIKNGGLKSGIPRDILSPGHWWHAGTAAPSNEPLLLVMLPQIIPQAEFSCSPHCLPSVFDIALCPLHKQGQVRFLTSRGSQTNYVVARAASPLGSLGHSASAELHGDRQNKCQHRAIRPEWKSRASVGSGKSLHMQ